MADKEKIARSIFRAIDELNQMLPANGRLEKSHATQLLGTSGKLDSLGFINLIVAVEEQILEDFGVTVSLADEKARSEKDNPFATVQNLVDYVSTLLGRETAE